jgi:hypothetical protein
MKGRQGIGVDRGERKVNQALGIEGLQNRPMTVGRVSQAPLEQEIKKRT